MKKRYIILITLLIAWLFIIHMERFKFRYQPEELIQRVTARGQQTPVFKTVQLDGRTLHYVQIGETPGKPLVVLVHGSPGSLGDYEGYLRDTHFSEGINLIAIDRPGFGYSDFGKPERSLKKQAALVGEMLKQFPNTPIILVGHSMGGPVVSKTAMDFPDLVDGMVVIAGSVAPHLEPSTLPGRILNFPLFQPLTPPVLRTCNQEILPLEQELNAIMSGWEEMRLPTTVVQGEKDNLVPAGNADFIKEKMMNSIKMDVVMLPEKDHFILWSEDILVKEKIREMVDFVTEADQSLRH